jgi:hypothetical protein
MDINFAVMTTFSGQIVIEAIDFIPVSSLELLEPTTTFLEYSFPTKE